MSEAKENDLGLLAKLRTWFENAEDGSAEARKQAETCRDYYDGDQLTDAERAVLRERGQPEMVANRIKPKINYLKGLEKKARMDPKAYPRNPGDEQGAQAATDSIRYVCDANVFDQISSRVWENMLIEGYGGADVVVEEGRDNEKNILVKLFRWDRLFFDPHSSEPDFSDAKFLGGVLWMDEDEVKANWPDADPAVITGAYEYSSGGVSGETYDDKPKGAVWSDYKRKRIRVVQEHWAEGSAWRLATFTAGGFLVPAADSPYLDDKGRPECSLILQSAYVDRDNNRYGAVKDMLGPQDEINKRRSKALHLLTMRQVVAEQGAVEDVDAARAELAKPDGYVEIAPQSKFEVVQTNDLAAGQFQLLQDAKSEIDAVGPSATMQGRGAASASGRSKAIDQQAGNIEVDGALLDQHRAWKHRVYRAIWNRVRQFWTEEKWIRVTEDERNVRFVGLNKPMTYGDMIEQMPPEQQQMAVQQFGIQPGDPRLQQPVIGRDGQQMIMNNVGELDVDIVVDESPDVASLQIEQFQQLAQLMPVIVQAIPPLALPVTEMLIEASSLKNKDKLLEGLKALQQPQPQQQGPDPAMVEAQARIAAKQAETQANIQAKQATTQADIAATLMKTRADIAIKGMSARQNAQLKAQQQAMQALTQPPPDPMQMQ